MLWRFAAKRQSIFFKKISDGNKSISDDEIIRKYKFTNTYRASDRTSQYLIRNVIYVSNQSPAEIAFRILLFKTFNKPETWEFLAKNGIDFSSSGFSAHRYSELFNTARKHGQKIYSSAYILPSGKSSFGSAIKHENHLCLLQKMISDHIGQRITETKSLKELYELLLAYPTIGPFLAFQYAIDINYSEITNFSEMDYVIAGPGARNGIDKCFENASSFSYEDLIKYTTENQEIEFKKRGLEFKNLWGRPLQLIDVQNLFCEIDKYSRVALPEYSKAGGRHKIKRLYSPNPKKVDYWYPPKWGINHLLREA